MVKAMKAKAAKDRRVPLTSREVVIIRRLKNVVKLPVTKIALAVERNKTTVYKALEKKWSRVPCLSLCGLGAGSCAKPCGSVLVPRHCLGFVGNGSCF